MEPASRPRSRSSRPSAGRTRAPPASRASTSLATPSAYAAPSAASDSASPWIRDATGRENLGLEGRIRGLRGAELRAPDRRAARSLRPARARPTGWRAPTPVACSASSTWRWASSTARGCSSWMSRPPDSTRRPVPSCGPRSAASRGRTVSPSCSPRTTWRRPIGSRAGSPSWTRGASSRPARRTS